MYVSCQICFDDRWLFPFPLPSFSRLKPCNSLGAEPCWDIFSHNHPNCFLVSKLKDRNTRTQASIKSINDGLSHYNVYIYIYIDACIRCLLIHIYTAYYLPLDHQFFVVSSYKAGLHRERHILTSARSSDDLGTSLMGDVPPTKN